MRKSLICRAFFVFMVNKSVAFAILLDHFLAYGIPMMVIHISNPAIQYMTAVSNPPKIIQIRLPKMFIIRCLS